MSQESVKSSGSEVKAAIIGGLFALIGYLLVETGVVDSMVRLLRTRDITIYADSQYSGSDNSKSRAFKSFQDANRTMTIGDSEDAQSRAFIVFYVVSIPEDAEITAVNVDIQCTVKGDPSPFKILRAKSIVANVYDSEFFDAYTSDRSDDRFPGWGIYDVVWRNTLSVINSCKNDNTLRFEYTPALTKAVAASRERSYFELVFWFSDESVNQNGQTDAIVINSLPRLHVTYIASRW